MARDRVVARLEQLAGRTDKLTGRVDKLTGRVDNLTGRVDKLTTRVDRLEKRVTTLASEQRQMRIQLNTLTRSHERLVVLHEDLALKVQFIAEGLLALQERTERGFAEVTQRIDGLAQRLDRLEPMIAGFIRTQGGLNRESREKFRDYDTRLRALENGRATASPQH